MATPGNVSGFSLFEAADAHGGARRHPVSARAFMVRGASAAIQRPGVIRRGPGTRRA